VSHIQRKGPGRWQARYRAPDGRERTKMFDRKADAERWLASQQTKISRGEWADPALARITVGVWGEQWLQGKTPTLKVSTRESYRSLWTTCILPTWRNVRLSDVSHAEVVAWVARLSTQVGASRCRKAAILFSGMLQAAVRDQRISRNPCNGVSLPRLQAKAQRFLNHTELQQLADQAGPYRVMILTLGLAGLRFGECAALKVADVNLLRRRLLVSHSMSEINGKLEWSSPKTHQGREVPIGQFLADLLAVEIAGKSPTDLLFSSPEGEPVRLSNWRRRVFDPAVAATGLAPLTPHDLRHTAASLAVASGAKVKHVQRMLGHASAAMTLDVYAGLFDDDLDQLTDRQDAAIAAAPPAAQIRALRLER
jgi:integrase